MPSIEITGIVLKVGQTEQKTDSFKSRQLIVQTDTSSEYPQELSIEFNQAKSTLLDVIAEGSEVKVSVNLNGRKWTDKQGIDKWFNSLNGWKIEVLSQAQEESDGIPF